MNVAIIVIGDELLLGNVTDTNSGLIARTLDPYGWNVRRVMTVADDADEILRAINLAFEVAPVVLTTGGLGPTKDDITKSVLCRYFGGELIKDEAVMENVRQIFERKHLDMNRLTATQAEVPSSCRVIQNPVGTAPVMWFEADGGKKVLVAMPGVPLETSVVFPQHVLPQLLAHFSNEEAVRHRSFTVSGVSESGLAEHLEKWETALPPQLHLAYLPVNGVIHLRLDCHASSQAMADELTLRAADELKNLVSPWLVAESDVTPAQILINALRRNNCTVATAESCTGGNIAHLITLNAGCSDVMLGGVVSYSNDVKIRLLGVDPAVIDTLGAVSEPVAAMMAEGVCRATGASIGISTSGIAGPGGATPDKPVGTVCIAASNGTNTIVRTHHFSGSRCQVIERASTAALLAAVTLLSDSNPNR